MSPLDHEDDTSGEYHSMDDEMVARCPIVEESWVGSKRGDTAEDIGPKF